MKTVKKRRHQGRTDYGKRMKLLKGGVPRLVFRRSNRYAIVQYVESAAAQDKIIKGTTSKELLKFGWPKEKSGSLASAPAMYLTGFLFGKKILKEKMKTPIVDAGMLRILSGSNFFAILKGLVDSGLEIECKKEVFPTEDRISGKHLKEDFSKTFSEIKLKIEKT